MIIFGTKIHYYIIHFVNLYYIFIYEPRYLQNAIGRTKILLRVLLIENRCKFRFVTKVKYQNRFNFIYIYLQALNTYFNGSFSFPIWTTIYIIFIRRLSINL